MEGIKEIHAHLVEKDIHRLTSLFQEEQLLEEGSIPSEQVHALYEILLRPSILDLPSMNTSAYFPNLISVLCSWKPSESVPAIDQTRIAFGILRLITSSWMEVHKWAKAFSWRDFSVVSFSAQFDKSWRIWESLLQNRLQFESDFFHSPPNTTFFELMTFMIRRTSHLLSTSELFERYRLFPRLVNLVLEKAIPGHHALDMMAALLQRGRSIWVKESKRLSRAMDLVTLVVEPGLDITRAHGATTVGTAAQVARSLVATAVSEFTLEEYLQLNNKICTVLAAAHESNKENDMIKRSIKEVVQTGLERRPPVVPDISVKQLWVRFVDLKADMPLIRAAQIAEAEFMRHAILDEIHETPGLRQALFPQRMIVSSVLSGPNSIPLIIEALIQCCTISLLDLDNSLGMLKDKHINITTEVLNHIGLAMENCAKNSDKAQWNNLLGDSKTKESSSADAVEVSMMQRRMVAAIAPYWLSSPHASVSFNKFLAIATFQIKRNGPEGTLESSLFLKYPRETALGIRSMLWDLYMLRYKCCSSSLSVLTDLVARFIQTDWFKDAALTTSSSALGLGAPLKKASFLLSEDDEKNITAEEIVSDILPLTWLMLKHVLTPSTVANSDQSSKKASIRGIVGANAPTDSIRMYMNPKAISAALRSLIVLFATYNTSPVIDRALTNISSWYPTLIMLPLWLKELRILQSEVVQTWKGTNASIRKQLIRRGYKFDADFSEVLGLVAEWLHPAEWTNLVTAPIPAPPSNPEHLASPKSPVMSTWASKQSKPVLNGSALFTGHGVPSEPSRPLPSSISESKHQSSPFSPGNKSSLPATTTKSMLPNHLRGKIGLSSHAADPVPPSGMTLQEKKEADAELQRKANEKRKQQEGSGGIAMADEAIVVKDTVGDRNKSKSTNVNEIHAKGRRMRLKSLDELYDRVLDLAFHTLTFPKDLTAGASVVPNMFSTADDYISTFEPLLLMELQAQMQSSRDDMVSDVRTKRILYKREYGISHEISVDKEKEWKSGDVYLMWPKSNSDPLSELKMLQTDASQMPHCIGVATKDQSKKSRSQKRQQQGLTMDGDDARTSIRVIVNANTKDHRSGLASKLLIGSDWNICPFFSLVTVLRQWSSLQSVESLAQLPDLLRPSVGDNPSFMPNLSSIQVRDIASKLNDARKFNPSQRSAVQEAIRNRGFSFIQGPPGTGKTRTLVGLLSAIVALQGAPVLVCTPSNSAINEVIDRIMTFGLYDMTSSKPDAFIKDFKLVRVGPNPDAPERIQQFALREICYKQFASKVYSDGLEKVEQSVLKGADIVCTTLTASASRALVNANIPFRTVIIDEAAQAVELETLIPLQYRCEQCIMIGDPQQLPATVFAKNTFLYERSLFARFSETMDKQRILLLNTQYRMHPSISLFPNLQFYQGQLLDGVIAEDSRWASSLLLPPNLLPSNGESSSSTASLSSTATHQVFSPVRFFDLTTSKSSVGGRSMGNLDEVNFIVALILKLLASNPKVIFDHKIVVITPYQYQRTLLMEKFNRQASSRSVFATIEVATVDSYQGRECDIVIFSSVRAARGASIGFLADVRRLNVALTRAKKSLWIIGKASALSANPIWKAMMDSIKERHLFTSVTGAPETWWSKNFVK